MCLERCFANASVRLTLRFCDRHFGGINYPVSASMGGQFDQRVLQNPARGGVAYVIATLAASTTRCVREAKSEARLPNASCPCTKPCVTNLAIAGKPAGGRRGCHSGGLAFSTSCTRCVLLYQSERFVLSLQIGGVGAIPEAMAEGIQEHGSYVEYKCNVKVG